MSEDFKIGHYKDKYGNWQPERRSDPDRRNLPGASHVNHERRKMFRRKVDREIFEKDHKSMIVEALEDFAAEHNGHL